MGAYSSLDIDVSEPVVIDGYCSVAAKIADEINVFILVTDAMALVKVSWESEWTT